MERAGDLLSSFFDKEFLKTAHGYSALFSSWRFLLKEQFGPKIGDRVADHSRIKDLERSILLIETDHPGWIQILQTKQDQLLKAVRRRFPSLDIRGLSFRLSRNGEFSGPEGGAVGKPDQVLQDSAEPDPAAKEIYAEAETGDRYEKIDDPDFKNALKRLEQSIIQNHRRSSSRRRKS
ncbi:MAG: DUF721 domain-containing protein [Treponema sp.]|jgi:hypothetical protein|nr:DUF721 domain-containing protein [Treponema sp.]